MKISINWLRSLLPASPSADECSSLLTGTGLEVEAMEAFESLRGGLKGFVVGEVLECGKHPDADRLSVTKVNVGAGEPLNIVCGAPNVAAGQKVIVATPGTMLYPENGEPFGIKRSKIRGAVSEGMICAEDEIGIGKSHDGILVLPSSVPVGTPAADYFKIENDIVLEIGLTPNRSDAASHLGVARDLAAVMNARSGNSSVVVSLPVMNPLPESTGLNKISINIMNPEACRRYSGVVISGVTVKESPGWLRNRLLAIGLKPINNIVDTTNFVLHELGQPLHAFDVEKIGGAKIFVRTAEEGEKFTTLDGVERTLKATDLVVCDEKKPMCLAGIFGGAESGVSENTRSVFIESAYFDAGFIRRSSKVHSLKTDASFRFERGTDPEMTVNALHRAASLILEIAGGSVSMDITDVYPRKLEPYKVAFSYKNCIDLIGKDIDRNVIKNIIIQLGMHIESEGTDGLLLHVPRYRNDVTREVDVIEEVMRIYGYDHVEVSKEIGWTAFNAPVNNEELVGERMSVILEQQGFSEIMTLSLSSEEQYKDQGDIVKVLNPLSTDHPVMRGNLLFSGLEAISYNVNRKNADLRLFEIGKTCSKNHSTGKYIEEKQLAIFVTGNVFGENPYGVKQGGDEPQVALAYLSGVVRLLLQKVGISELKIEESIDPLPESGISFKMKGQEMTEVGTVQKTQLKSADLRQPVYFARLHMERLAKAFGKRSVRYAEPGKFPSVRRDLALLIDKAVRYQQIEEIAFNTEKKFLSEVNIFDIYEGKQLGDKKSYAVSFILQNPEVTLTDKQIDSVMDKLISNFKQKLGAELR